MNRTKIMATGLLAIATLGASLALGAGAASAATTPPWEPDTNSQGNIVFYDAAGNVVTGGNNLSHLFDYAVATSADSNPNRHPTKGQVYFAGPDHNNPNLTTWFQAPASSATNFPIAGAPGAVGSATFPATQAGSTEGNLAAFLQQYVNDTTAGYANIVQLRLFDSGAGVGQGKLQSPYWQADISYDSAAGTWSQIYPAPAAVATTTTTTLVANPTSTTNGQSVQLTATVSPSAAGKVQFSEGANTIGSPVTVSGGTASISSGALAIGSHTFTASFTPDDPAAFKPSSGNTVVSVGANATTTTLGVTGNTSVDGNPETFTATVSPSATSGSVVFQDNGTTIPGSITTPTAGTYVLTKPTGLGAGAHSVVAKFTSADPNFSDSQSAPAVFNTNAATSPCAQTGSVCTDPQNIQATIPVGTLVINTPYTSTSPLDLGTLALDPTGTYFTGSKAFTNIKVTDTRSGALPWTVTALSSDLSDGGSNTYSKISAQNVGLTGINATKSGGFTGTVQAPDNTAATPPVVPGAPGSQGLGGTTPHVVATADHGPGVVTMNGTLTINAPAATEAGLFKGVITFTVG